MAKIQGGMANVVLWSTIKAGGRLSRDCYTVIALYTELAPYSQFMPGDLEDFPVDEVDALWLSVFVALIFLI